MNQKKNNLVLKALHNEFQGDSLSHHGVEGMKWGVRRYQPYPTDYSGDGKFVGKSPKQIQRRLNKLERKIAKNSSKAYKADKLGDIYRERGERKVSTDVLNGKEVKGDDYKLPEWKKRKEAQSYRDANKELIREVDAILKNANNLGYKISERKFEVIAERGKEYMIDHLYRALGQPTFTNMDSFARGLDTIETKSYKVKA